MEGINEVEIRKMIEDVYARKERNYEISADFTDFSKIIKIGKTQQERLWVLIMCYYVNPTLKDILDNDLKDVIEYIKETDETYDTQDYKYIDKCVEVIKECKIAQRETKERDLKQDIRNLIDEVFSAELNITVCQDRLEDLGLLDKDIDNKLNEVKFELEGMYKVCQRLYKNEGFDWKEIYKKR